MGYAKYFTPIYKKLYTDFGVYFTLANICIVLMQELIWIFALHLENDISHVMF